METKEKIYLDYNATSPVGKKVAEVMAGIMAQPLNASSVHNYGREAKKHIEDARRKIAKIAGVEGAQVIFTGSGTEANNLAIKGFRDANTVEVSTIEHASVIKAAEDKKPTYIPVDKNGVVRLDALEGILKHTSGKVLVSVMLANNETGVIQPIKEVVKLVLAHGGFVHTDAVQAFGRIPVDFNDLNVDMMTISAHKIGGPQGIGALIIKKGLHLSPQILGGGQESGYRAGTHNVAAIVGFAAAAVYNSRLEGGNYSSHLRDYMEKKLKSIAQDITIFGEDVARIPNTSCIVMPGMKAETQLINFDLEGIAVSAGSACSSGKVEASHVLLAMGVDKEKAATAIRVSVGPETTREEIDRFVEVWKRQYERADIREAA